MTCLDCDAPCGVRRSKDGRRQWVDKRVQRCRSCAVAKRHRDGSSSPPVITPESRAKMREKALARGMQR